MKIGLFFGSFNPIHKGHLTVARFMAAKTDLDRVWIIVSPQNPFKDTSILSSPKKRYEQVRKAVSNYKKIKASNVEFKLPQPSYTINTLAVLKEKFPQHQFVVVMGSDNLLLFKKWKDYKEILKGYQLYVYPRNLPVTGMLQPLLKHKNVKLFDAVRIDISSTEIRERRRKKQVR